MHSRKPVNIRAFNMAVAQLLESVTHQYNDFALQFGEWRGVPSVQPRNVEEFSKRYIDHTPNERIVTLGQGLSSLALSPDVEISSTDREDVLHHTKNGGVLLIVGNHVKGIDPLTFSAVVCREPAFEVIKHDIIIPAKPVIFRIPGIRHLAEGMGSFPVIRKKDVLGKDGKVSKENKVFQTESGKFTVELMVNHLVGKASDDIENVEDVKGGSDFIMAEGERNKGNPLDVQEFDMGAVYMYEKALRRGAKVAILTTGVVYDAGSMFRATVHIGGLIEPKGKGLNERSESIRKAVQHNVDEARRVGYRNK